MANRLHLAQSCQWTKWRQKTKTVYLDGTWGICRCSGRTHPSTMSTHKHGHKEQKLGMASHPDISRTEPKFQPHSRPSTPASNELPPAAMFHSLPAARWSNGASSVPPPLLPRACVRPRRGPTQPIQRIQPWPQLALALPSGRGEKHEPSNNIEQTDQAALKGFAGGLLLWALFLTQALLKILSHLLQLDRLMLHRTNLSRGPCETNSSA